jgi:hypothetical protein
MRTETGIPCSAMPAVVFKRWFGIAPGLAVQVIRGHYWCRYFRLYPDLNQQTPYVVMKLQHC